MKTMIGGKRDRENDERRAAGLPDVEGERGLEADIGAGVGLVAGALAGAIAGPIGAVVGATIGSVVGEATGAAIHRQEHERTMHDHELDDAIGVTSGPIGAGAPITFVDLPTEAAFLRADHSLLGPLAEQIVAAIEEDDPVETSRAMTLLQGQIRDHLAREEREVLPGFAAHAPADAERIRREHDEIRATLDTMEVETDLHALRATQVRALLEKLRAHAAREEGGLYVWAAKEAAKS